MKKIMNTKMKVIGKKYAQALIEIAKDKGELNKILEDLVEISDAFEISKELYNFLKSPIVKIEDKKDTMRSLFKNRLNEDTLNFVELLLDNNRIGMFDAIVYCYRQSLDEINEVARGTVLCAVDLDDDQKYKIEKKLSSKLSKEVHLDYEVDNSIIAGIVIKLGDKLIDGSVKTRLKKIKEELMTNR